MCSSTNDEEGKNNAEKTPLHLSPPVALTNGDLGKTNPDEGSSPSSFPNVFKKEESKDDESKIDPILVSLSLSHVGAKRAEGKTILSLLDDGESKFDHQNSSFLANSDRAFSENGSISEGKETSDSDNVEVSNKPFCGGMTILPAGVCEGSTDFAEQMDIFMRCQHPLDILAIFNEDGRGGSSETINPSFSADTDGDSQVNRVSGYHALPRACEYCGSPNIDLCRDSPDCERPKSYFLREKPPFYAKGGLKWKEEKNNGRVPLLNLTKTQKRTWQL